MSFSAFQEKILSEASAQAKQISHNNALLILQEQERSMKELQELEENIVSAATKEAERTSKIIHQQAELTGRSLILQAKQGELLRAKEAFRETLESLSPQKKKAVREALSERIPSGKGEVEDAPDGNGIIFRGKGVEATLTFSSLADQLFLKYRSELAKELFS